MSAEGSGRPLCGPVAGAEGAGKDSQAQYWAGYARGLSDAIARWGDVGRTARLEGAIRRVLADGMGVLDEIGDLDIYRELATALAEPGVEAETYAPTAVPEAAWAGWGPRRTWPWSRRP